MPLSGFGADTTTRSSARPEDLFGFGRHVGRKDVVGVAVEVLTSPVVPHCRAGSVWRAAICTSRRSTSASSTVVAIRAPLGASTQVTNSAGTESGLQASRPLSSVRLNSGNDQAHHPSPLRQQACMPGGVRARLVMASAQIGQASTKAILRASMDASTSRTVTSSPSGNSSPRTRPRTAGSSMTTSPRPSL